MFGVRWGIRLPSIFLRKEAEWLGKRASLMAGIYELIITVCNYIHDNDI